MTRFTGIAAVEGTPTGDGRLLDKDAIVFEATGPYPLLYHEEGDHNGTIIGTINKVWRSGAEIRIEGDLHTESSDAQVVAFATRVSELSDEGLAGLSVGLDDESVEIRIKAELLEEINESMEDPEIEAEDTSPETDPEGRITVARWESGDEMYVVTSGRLREVSVVFVPALIEGQLSVESTRPEPAAVAASNSVGRIHAVGAALSVVANPNAAFRNPNFGADDQTDDRLVWQKPLRSDETGHYGAPLTITPEGEIYGHLATKGRCHGAYNDSCINLDSLDPTYSFDEFLTGEAVPGTRTGPLVANTSHSVNADGSVKDFEWLANTGDAIADVTVGMDAHGVWVAGRVRPGITDQQLAALKGGALSGEWLPSPGKMGLRLAGILVVNNPGYAIARRPVAASNGRVTTTGPVCASCLGEDPYEARMKTLEAALAASLMRGVTK